jgi:hypothetical protein
VTAVPTSELVKREEVIEKQRLAAAQAEVKQFKEREADIAFRENKARQRIKEKEKEAATRLQRIQADVDADDKLNQSKIARYFLRSKVMLEEKVRTDGRWMAGKARRSPLTKNLTSPTPCPHQLHSQQAMLKEKFGRLKASQTSAARRYSLMWDKVPQPVEIRVHMMKSVSSKLRKGNYCLLVSMYSRLGGHQMR